MKFAGSFHLPALVLAVALTAMAASASQAEDAVASSGSSAILQLGAAPPVPPGERRTLVIALLGFEPPVSGPVSAIVAVRDDASPAIEVGRVSPYPATAFKARSQDEAQRFLFDLTTVVPPSGGGSWSVEIWLESLDQDRPVTGARMHFGWAQFSHL
jgi:hypothetical protein